MRVGECVRLRQVAGGGAGDRYTVGGIDLPPLTVVAQQGPRLLLRCPGFSGWVGRFSPREYVPVMYYEVVWLADDGCARVVAVHEFGRRWRRELAALRARYAAAVDG